MREKQGTSLMLLVLYGLLIGALLALVVAGAKLYGSAVEAKNRRSDRRLALSYVQSQMAFCEGADTAAVVPGPQGDMLVLREPDSGYETRIYLYDSALRSEFSRTDGPVDPAGSEKICGLGSFSLRESGGVLYITADGSVAVQAMGGGGAHD